MVTAGTGDVRQTVYIVGFGLINFLFLVIIPLYVFVHGYKRAKDRGDTIHGTVINTLISFIVSMMILMNAYDLIKSATGGKVDPMWSAKQFLGLGKGAPKPPEGW